MKYEFFFFVVLGCVPLNRGWILENEFVFSLKRFRDKNEWI